MPIKYLGRFLLMFAAVLAANCAWADDAPRVVPLGNNDYSITVKATHKFTRNTEKLKEQAMAAATQFCAKEGKQLKVVSVKEDKSFFMVGDFAQATLTFKALSPGDPELNAPAEAQGRPAMTEGLTTEALYADLLKLDDLHKKGILTDAEFDAEKKKVLARSK